MDLDRLGYFLAENAQLVAPFPESIEFGQETHIPKSYYLCQGRKRDGTYCSFIYRGKSVFFDHFFTILAHGDRFLWRKKYLKHVSRPFEVLRCCLHGHTLPTMGTDRGQTGVGQGSDRGGTGVKPYAGRTVGRVWPYKQHRSISMGLKTGFRCF